MAILVLLIFIALTVWAVIDYKKINNELSRCPKCNQKIKQKFPWRLNNKPISISGKEGEQKFNVTIYKCQNCGFSWNHTSEYNENTT